MSDKMDIKAEMERRASVIELQREHDEMIENDDESFHSS
jgi:hypothetical protein